MQFNIQAPPKTTDPIGTLGELRELGIDSRRYATCSTPGSRNAGCPFLADDAFYPCEFAYKGLEVEEGGGPRNHAVFIKHDTGSSNVVFMACFHYMAALASHRATGTVFEVVGQESDGQKDYATKGSIETIEVKIDGTKKIIVQPHLFISEIPIYPRPKDNPLLAEELQSMKIGNQIRNKALLRRASALAGVVEDPLLQNGPRTPMDQEIEERMKEKRLAAAEAKVKGGR